jgi:putative PIG3 family NAD(P)H quinone oxidoreductase
LKAVVVEAPGGPENLVLHEVAEPRPLGDQLLIDVRATALNRADLLQRRGRYPPPPGASEILGLECAGSVVGVGPDVTSFRVGDRLMALLAGGGYAERAVVSERLAMKVPDAMSFEQAAAIPEAFLTADEALFGLAGLAPRETVLIHAAASGVGTAALQLARCHGARAVAAAGSAAKLDLARELGAALLIDRRREDFADVLRQAGVAPDVVLDVVGARYAAAHAECLAVGGRWVVMGTLSGAEATLDLGRVLRRRLRIFGLVMRSRSDHDKAEIVARFSRRWLPLFADGTLRPVVDSVLPIERVADAHRRMEQNENLGKLVLTFA